MVNLLFFVGLINRSPIPRTTNSLTVNFVDFYTNEKNLQTIKFFDKIIRNRIIFRASDKISELFSDTFINVDLLWPSEMRCIK